MRTANRVVLNSVALYVNMVVSIFVTLLVTRLVLLALGSVEYGAYVLVANMVAMFSFVNVAMSVATQRFMSYAIGENEQSKINEAFYNNVITHISIAVLSAFLLLTLGWCAVEFWLDIPANLHTDVVAVLFFVVAGAVFTILSVPYDGLMNAREDIVAIAAINILDSVIKLLASVAIMFVEENKLIVYAALVMLSSFVTFYKKRGFCIKHYDEATFKWHRIEDRGYLSRMVKFAGWNLIGAACSLAKYQGVAVLLNRFFGLVTNAAYGLSQQLNGFLLFFANSSLRPLRPLIVKNEASGRHGHMVKFAFMASKFTFLLLCVVVIPIYVNLPMILDLWLVKVPEGTIEFCKCFLLVTLINQLSMGQQIGLESCGRIKMQQLIVGFMHLMPLLAGYIFFHLGYPVTYIVYCIIAEEIVCLVARVLIARVNADMPVLQYLFELLLPCVVVALLSFYIADVVGDRVFLVSQTRTARLAVTVLLNCATMATVGYFVCMTSYEKACVKGIISSIKKKVFVRHKKNNSI